MIILKKCLLLLLLAIICNACVNNTYTLKVDAIKSSWDLPKNYYFFNKKIDILEFNEISQYLEIDLGKHGYKKVTPDQASIIITLAYTASDPIIYRTTSSSLASTYESQASRIPNLNRAQRRESAFLSGFASGLQGASDQEIIIITKATLVAAYDKKNFSPLWRTYFTLSNNSSNLRAWLPYMIECASPYFDTNFNDTITCNNLKTQ